MTPLIRRSVAAAAVGAVLLFGMAGAVPTIAAQDAGASKTKTKAKAPDGARSMRRVPSYFGSLGLTSEQRDDIYAVNEKYVPQIQELQNKIEGLRERMMSDCEDVLTPAQKKILAEARKTAADRRKSASRARSVAGE